MSLNTYSFTGNLGKDASVNNVSGTTVANFSVAVQSGFGDRAQTLWIDCALWGKLAESGLVDYLKKGQRVSVSGNLGTREYEGKTYLTVRVSDISLEGGKQEDRPAPTPRQEQKPKNQNSNQLDDDDDSPF